MAKQNSDIAVTMQCVMLLCYNDYNGDRCLTYIAIIVCTTTRVAVDDRKAGIKPLTFSSHWKRSELHFSESQRVEPVELPRIPHHTVIVRRCVVADVVVAVQVGVMTATFGVPPATFACNSTRAAWPLVVVLVSSAELLSKMTCQWITFTQQTEHWHVSLNSSIVAKISAVSRKLV